MGSIPWDWEMGKKDAKAYLLWGEGRDEVFPVCFSRCWKEFLQGC